MKQYSKGIVVNYQAYYITLVAEVAQKVKNLPAMWETQVRALSQENPLEKGMATHSRIFSQRLPQTEKPGGLQCMGSQRVAHDRATNTFTFMKVSCPSGPAKVRSQGSGHVNSEVRLT